MSPHTRQPGRPTLRWRIVLSVWGCVVVAVIGLSLLANDLASRGLSEAASREAATHASYLTADLPERPSKRELHDLNAALRRVIASSDALAIAVYRPVRELRQMTRVAVQSASDSTLHHFPQTIPRPTQRVSTESFPSDHADVQIVTAITMAAGELRGAVRLASTMGRAGSIIAWHRVFVALVALALLGAAYWMGKRIANSVLVPLHVLAGRTKRLAEGEFEADLALDGLPEFQDIEANLNILSHRLSELDATHESRVRALRTRLSERSRMLEQSGQEMQSLEKAKETFLSNLSHEMRTPLTSIMAAEEILTKYADESPETRGEFLQIINQESRRLLNQIGKLLDLAKLEAKALQLNLERTDLCHLVEDTSAQVFSQGRDRTVALSMTKHSDKVFCECDVERITRVLGSLVENAFRYSPHNGTVRVTVCPDDEWVKVTVEDDGGGSDERFTDLFDEWNPANIDLTPSPLLGHAVAQKLVKAHRGTLKHESTPTGGTLVELRLPALAAALSVDDTAVELVDSP